MIKRNLEEAPLTIGGFLFLVALRLIIGIANSGNSVLQTIGMQLDTAGQTVRTLSALLILYCFVVLALFFKRHKAFPVAYIVMESLNLIFNIFELFIIYNIRSLPMDALQIVYIAFPISISILWIIYMLFSMRVKRTFVFSWNQTLDRRLADKANSF